MNRFEQSKLWQKSLAPQLNDDIFLKERELLRVEYEKFRDRATLVANEIAKDLPQFTVHDINHIDALWNISDLLVKDNFRLTPPEAFVLGGAFLIHDLGMGLAAYPDGIDQLRNNTTWIDTISFHYKKDRKRKPTAADLTNPDSEIEEKALDSILRLLHAKHAENLALTPWKNSTTGEIYHLIDNTELRESYGKIIGLIAHSHWWNVDELMKKIPLGLGAPGIFPQEWTIDPIKIACVLRIADASNVDDRRSPGFLRAIRKITGYADLHWDFQQRLYQPRIENDRLVYTSKMPFKAAQADSWWLCFDTLKLLDDELKDVDSLLSETNRERLAVIGVANIESPERLSKLITVDNWKPVDAKIRVGNVAKLALQLGGSSLYGEDYTVPIRELIQNSTDAIKARRILENENENWGHIIVRKGKNEQGEFIEIEDNGTGMSPRVMTGPFLDFGESFWGSSLMHEELPGLEAKNFESTGRYGIGFFSVFMIGEKIQVYSRRYEASRDDTWCLEFMSGINSRPLLRKANSNEYIKDGGTKIRIYLLNGIYEKLTNYSKRYSRLNTLPDILQHICTALEVNLLYEGDNLPAEKLIEANDWLTVTPLELIKRVCGRESIEKLPARAMAALNKYLDNMQVIEEGGMVLGRCFLGEYHHDTFELRGILVVGGLKAEDTMYMNGVILAKPAKASRDRGLPIASVQAIADWTTSQLEVLSTFKDLPNHSLAKYAILGWQLNARPEKLPICINLGKWINSSQLRKILLNLKKVVVVDPSYSKRLPFKDVRWEGNIFFLETSLYGFGGWQFQSSILNQRGTIVYYFLQIVAEEWGMSLTDLIKQYDERTGSNQKIAIGIFSGTALYETDYFAINKP